MKTDEELTEPLRRAGRMIRPPQDPVERLYRRRSRKRRDDRLMAGALALLLLGAAVGGSLFALGGFWAGGHGVGTSGGWTPVRYLELGPGQYFYLKAVEFGVGDASRIDQETWWSPDGSGELRFDTNRPDKYIPFPPEGDYRKGSFPLPYQRDLSSMAADPRILEEQLRELADRDGTSVWRAVVNMLDFERSPHALPGLRASLFEVASGLDGVTRREVVEDPVGRNAVTLDFTDKEECVRDQCAHWVLSFDPGTHQLMDEAVGYRDDPVPFLVLQSAIVDVRGAEPTETQLLFPRPAHPLEPPPQPSPNLP